MNLGLFSLPSLFVVFDLIVRDQYLRGAPKPEDAAALRIEFHYPLFLRGEAPSQADSGFGRPAMDCAEFRR
jgi:hypothetical protein